jgi:hypothetical protein
MANSRLLSASGINGRACGAKRDLFFGLPTFTARISTADPTEPPALMRRTVTLLCAECHAIWESDKDGACRDFKRQQLGEEGLAELDRRARSSIKFGQWEVDRKYKKLSLLTSL